jgi:hypothetical protein
MRQLEYAEQADVSLAKRGKMFFQVVSAFEGFFTNGKQPVCVACYFPPDIPRELRGEVFPQECFQSLYVFLPAKAGFIPVFIIEKSIPEVPFLKPAFPPDVSFIYQIHLKGVQVHLSGEIPSPFFPGNITGFFWRKERIHCFYL